MFSSIKIVKPSVPHGSVMNYVLNAAFVLFLASPVGGKASFAQRKLAPANLGSTPSYLSNDERILLLEKDAREHELSDAILEQHLTERVDDILRKQGSQNEKIAALEMQMDVVYRFGGLIAFVLTLSVPFFLWILNRTQSHNQRIASSINELTMDMRLLKVSLGIKNATPTYDTKEDEAPCLL